MTWLTMQLLEPLMKLEEITHKCLKYSEPLLYNSLKVNALDTL